MRKTLTAKLAFALLVLGIVGIAGVASAAPPASDAPAAATLQAATEQPAEQIAPAATAPQLTLADLTSSMTPQAQFLSGVTAQSCDPPEACAGHEAEYCQCLGSHNALCCYKEYCSEFLDCF